MVARKDLEKKYALISIYNKNKLKYLCTNLNKNNYNFISTGSTGSKIRELGYKCLEVSKITGFKEMFDGRIKTINPQLFSSLLYIRDNPNHVKQFHSLKVPNIELVVVNLYPFEKYSKANNKNKAIEMIDIGGPSLIRAASKNYRFITTVTDTNDYSKLITNLNKNGGETDLKFRKEMAKKTFKITSNYDRLIFDWFSNEK